MPSKISYDLETGEIILHNNDYYTKEELEFMVKNYQNLLKDIQKLLKIYETNYKISRKSGYLGKRQ